eukprot:gene2085-4074_t
MAANNFGTERDVKSESCHYVRFNQDVTCVAIGTAKGFSIHNLDPIERRYVSASEGIGIIEMLYSTSLIALVGSGDTPGSSPRRLRLCKSHTMESICELPFNSTILSVRMNKCRLLVCLENHIHIYDLVAISCLQVLATASNPEGLIAISRENKPYMAFPSTSFPSSSPGDVILYDCMSLRILSQISAHKSTVVAIEFNRSGTMLATASQTGTVIRVFRCPSGEHLHSFRRGSYSVHINSISFCPHSLFLSAGSSSGTVHIFALDPHHHHPRDDNTATSTTSSTSSTSSVRSNIIPSSNCMGVSTDGTMTTQSQSQTSTSTPDSGAVAANPWQATLLTGSRLLSSSMVSLGRGLLVLGGERYLHMIPEPIQEFAESCRAVAQARVPVAEVGVEFKAAIMSVTSETEGVRHLKIVVISKSGILHKFSIPSDCSLTQNNHSNNNNGNNSSNPLNSTAIVNCVLEDEAFLCED